MEENTYLVPANTKKSLLIFNILRPMPDLIILIAGVLLSVVFLATLNSSSVWLLLVACLPMLIAVALVMPIPNYHNTLVAIQSILRFYNSRRNYVWKGWCMTDEFKDSK